MNMVPDDTITAMLPDLVGSRVLFVGGGGSVGRTTAKLAKRLGATPLVADLEAGFARARETIGDDVETFEVDARDAASAASALDTANADHIVLCTGRPFFQQAHEFDLPATMEWIGERIEPLLAIAKWIARNPDQTRSFTVVGGFIGRRPQPGLAVMSSIMPMILGIIEHLALELSPTRVNMVGPGPMVDSQMAKQAAGGDEGVVKLTEVIEASVPARRAVRLHDTARQILYLVGDPAADGSFRPVESGATFTGLGID